MNTVINLDILDNENLKPVHINLFLNLVRLSESGEVRVSVTDLMKCIRCSNRKRVIDYLKVLKENNVIDFSSENGVTNTYKLNSKYFFK